MISMIYHPFTLTRADCGTTLELVTYAPKQNTSSPPVFRSEIENSSRSLFPPPRTAGELRRQMKKLSLTLPVEVVFQICKVILYMVKGSFICSPVPSISRRAEFSYDHQGQSEVNPESSCTARAQHKSQVHQVQTSFSLRRYKSSWYAGCL